MIFAHPSEKLFSDHLDLFDIEWIYEPVSFPLEWGSGCLLYTSPSPRDS